jgi:hypothetical protein
LLRTRPTCDLSYTLPTSGSGISKFWKSFATKGDDGDVLPKSVLPVTDYICSRKIGAGRIHGRFSFCAHGQCARLIDERWKQLSLTMDDHRQSGQEALCEFLPSSAVLTYAREVETSGFHVSGQHSRGPLVPLGKNGRVIGTLLWDVPFLPVRYWRTLQLNQLFVVVFPMTVRMDTRLEGDLYRFVDDVSRVRTLDNPVCTIGEEVEDDGSALTVRRTIVVKNKYTHGEEVKLVPGALERIDEARQLVISIDGVA